MKKITLLILKIYKIVLSPILRMLLGSGCRYNPTCSEFAVIVIQKHGLLKGGVLAAKRLSTCHL